MISRPGLLLGAALAVLALALPRAHADDSPQSGPGSPDLERDAVQDVIFLSDVRPDLHPSALRCRGHGIPGGVARHGESHPCLPRPR